MMHVEIVWSFSLISADNETTSEIKSEKNTSFISEFYLFVIIALKLGYLLKIQPLKLTTPKIF